MGIAKKNMMYFEDEFSLPSVRTLLSCRHYFHRGQAGSQGGDLLSPVHSAVSNPFDSEKKKSIPNGKTKPVLKVDLIHVLIWVFSVIASHRM